MGLSIKQVAASIGLSVAAIGMLGWVGTAAVRAQSSDNVNDVFDSNQNEIFGDNGLNINGLIDASRQLEQGQDEPWGLREETVDEEVNRFRTDRERRFGPDIIQEESSSATDEVSVQPETDSTGDGSSEGEAVGTEAIDETASESESAESESLDGEASEIAP